MALRMTRVDPIKNMARFYEIDVHPTLFGEYTVERHWGRIGSLGHSKTFWFADEDAANEMVRKVSTAQVRRGYSGIELSSKTVLASPSGAGII